MDIYSPTSYTAHIAALMKYPSYAYNILPIKTKNGIELVKPYPYQINLLENVFPNNKKVIIYKSRQLGATTNFQIHHYLKLILEPHRNILFSSKTEIEAIDFLKSLYQIYDNAPQWLKDYCPIRKQTQSECEFSNGSKIRAVTTTESTGRSGAYTDVTLDEYAWIEIDKYRFFTSVLGCITQTNGNLIVNSTANGLDHFYSLWNGAKAGENGFYPVFLGFFSIEDRTQTLHDDLMKTFPSRDLGLQENPRTEDEGFIASGRPVFDVLRLKEMLKMCSDAPYRGFLENENGRLVFKSHEHENLYIWQHPVNGRDYRIGVDPAEGYEGDYSVIVVMDAKSYEQVAMYRTNRVDTHLLADILYQTAIYYNDAFVCVERNNDGKTVLERLYHTLGYTNLYFEERIDSATKEVTTKYGWPQTSGNKDHLIAIQQRHISEGILKINSKSIIQEHMTFYVQNNQKKMANAGCHDDTVIACALATAMCELYPAINIDKIRRYRPEAPRGVSGYG